MSSASWSYLHTILTYLDAMTKCHAMPMPAMSKCSSDASLWQVKGFCDNARSCASMKRAVTICMCIKYVYMWYFLIYTLQLSFMHTWKNMIYIYYIYIYYIYILYIYIPPSSTSRVQAKMLPKRGRWQPQADRIRRTGFRAFRVLCQDEDAQGSAWRILKMFARLSWIFVRHCSTLSGLTCSPT